MSWRIYVVVKQMQSNPNVIENDKMQIKYIHSSSFSI